MSTTIMWVLIGFYTVITVFAACERNWWRVLYFIGAIIISLAVIGMTSRPRIRGPPLGPVRRLDATQLDATQCGAGMTSPVPFAWE